MDKFSNKHQSVFKQILEIVKNKESIDTGILLEQFGEEPIDQLIKQGELIEINGKLRIMM